MTSQELLEVIYSWENLSFTIREIGNHPEHFTSLMEVALYSNDPKSWRAAWMADKIHDNHPEMILPFLEKMTEQLKVEQHSGKKRHFLKLISMHEPDERYQGFLFDYCLNAFSSDSEPPAVRVHAMQILYNISEKEPGLKPELLDILEHEMEYHSTAGILARGLKLVKKLRRQTR